jgi:Fur family transcriptional regulator, ferric uptake regulator
MDGTGSTSTAPPALTWRDVAALLRRRHHRLTPQRRAVVEAMAAFEGHVSASQLVERCLERDPAFVPSTVYRTLDLLEELGLVTHIHDADGREEFQPTSKEPHAHLICRRCGHTQELPAAEINDLLGRVQRDHDFAVDVGHLAIFGVCDECAAPH